MRKLLSVALVAILFFASNVRAEPTKLFELNKKMYQEYQALQEFLPKTKDVALGYTMWDSSIITIIQLNAYFSMVGIIDSIGRGVIKEKSVEYLVIWLNDIKRKNEINLRSIAMVKPTEEETSAHAKKLGGYFMELNVQVDNELKRLGLLKNAIRAQQKSE